MKARALRWSPLMAAILFCGIWIRMSTVPLWSELQASSVADQNIRAEIAEWNWVTDVAIRDDGDSVQTTTSLLSIEDLANTMRRTQLKLVRLNPTSEPVGYTVEVTGDFRSLVSFFKTLDGRSARVNSLRKSGSGYGLTAVVTCEGE